MTSLLCVRVDGTHCCGHARCWTVAKEFYSLDEDGYNIYRGTTVAVPAEMEQAARLGARACPDKAITIVDG